MKLIEAIKAALRMWLCPPEDTPGQPGLPEAKPPLEREPPPQPPTVEPIQPTKPSDPITYEAIAPEMPTGNKITRALKFLHPALRYDLEDALEECHSKGLMVYVFESYRTLDRQQWLYEQGRTREGRIVTNARPLYSWHSYGLAFDLVFDGDERDGIQWSWEGDFNSDPLEDDKRDDYTRVGEIFERYGFEWAARWRTYKETPHFQKVFDYSVGEAIRLYDVKGVQGVWDEITERHRRELSQKMQLQSREQEVANLVHKEEGVVRSLYDNS